MTVTTSPYRLVAPPPAAPVPADTWTAAWTAREIEHRAETAKLRMLITTYRALLEQHNIDPPDIESEDLLALTRACAKVVAAASELTATIGTSAELLRDTWR